MSSACFEEGFGFSGDIQRSIEGEGVRDIVLWRIERGEADEQEQQNGANATRSNPECRKVGRVYLKQQVGVVPV